MVGVQCQSRQLSCPAALLIVSPAPLRNPRVFQSVFVVLSLSPPLLSYPSSPSAEGNEGVGERQWWWQLLLPLPRAVGCAGDNSPSPLFFLKPHQVDGVFGNHHTDRQGVQRRVWVEESSPKLPSAERTYPRDPNLLSSLVAPESLHSFTLELL